MSKEAEKFIEEYTTKDQNDWLVKKKEIIAKFMESYHNEQLRIANFRRSVSVEIQDSDIATIEALHDLLLDAHGYSLDFITLKRARELTAKMYNALK